MKLFRKSMRVSIATLVYLSAVPAFAMIYAVYGIIEGSRQFWSDAWHM